MHSVPYLYYSLKKANEINKLNSYLFFLQLKSISSTGEFKTGEILQKIKSSFPEYSNASISKNLKALIENNFAYERKTKTGGTYKIQLRSTRKVLNKFGFRFSKTEENNHRFEKININELTKKELKSLLFSLEIKRNQENQSFKIKDKEQRRKKESVANKKSYKHSKPNSTIEIISCTTSASLIGFKSKLTGISYQKQSEQNGYLKITRDKNKLVCKISKKIFMSQPDQFDKCFWKYGKVITHNSNSISFLTDNIRKKGLIMTNSLQIDLSSLQA